MVGRSSPQKGVDGLRVPTIVSAGAWVNFAMAVFQWVTIWSLLSTKVGIVLPSMICDRAISLSINSCSISL